MKPQEKAIQIYNKFYGIPLYLKTVKECCHILVDELLNEYPAQCPENSYEKERHLFWQEVKEEINKL
jgi:hypothetical protein